MTTGGCSLSRYASLPDFNWSLHPLQGLAETRNKGHEAENPACWVEPPCLRFLALIRQIHKVEPRARVQDQILRSAENLIL